MDNKIKNIVADKDARTLEEEIERGQRIEKRNAAKKRRGSSKASKKSYWKTFLQYKKQAAIGGGGFFLILLLAFGLYVLSLPRQGSLIYGACKIFLELYVQYPDHLRLTDVYEFQTDDYVSARIWFTQLDGFGQYRMEPFQCFFREDPMKGFYLDKITVSRRELEPETIENFNRILPGLQNMEEMNLDYPYPFASSIKDLKFETDRFRKRLF